MSRRYDQPVDCWTDAEGQPVRFRFKNRTYYVQEVIDSWIEIGEWWNGEPETRWYRVQTHDRGVFELYSPTETVAWRLWKVLD